MRHGIMLLTLIVLLAGRAYACIWDDDTLEMERQRFPTALELITGKFVRHSKAFYEWRIQDRTSRLKQTPGRAPLIDDLAVAWEKTGNRARAIALMLELEKKAPGRYETAANLGTFYLHDGQIEEGLKWIERALELNPDAHFGREKYQRLLVLYVQKARARQGDKLPLRGERFSFVGFLLGDEFDRDQRQGESGNAIKGVLGMMRFGNHESPILLEVLGELLGEEYTWRRGDAKQLATRAFLKASYGLDNADAQQAYRHMAADALRMQRDDDQREMSLDDVERALKLELDDAARWYAEVEADEKRWIAEGKNPEAEFKAKYYTPSVVEGTPARMVSRAQWRWLLGTVALVILFTLWYRLFPRRTSST